MANTNTVADDAGSEFDFTCPHCRNDLSVPTSMNGNTAECPSCGKSIFLRNARTLRLKGSISPEPATTQASKTMAEQPALPQSETTGAFITKEFDEFTNISTIRHIHAFTLLGRIDSCTLVMKKSSSLERMGLLARITSFGDRFNDQRGALIFNCDQINHTVPFTIESVDSEEQQAYSIGNGVVIPRMMEYSELGHYALTQQLLKAICEARVLKIRIQGATERDDPELDVCSLFQKYCRQFYNNVYDSSLYGDAVVEERTDATSVSIGLGGYWLGLIGGIVLLIWGFSMLGEGPTSHPVLGFTFMAIGGIGACRCWNTLGL